MTRQRKTHLTILALVPLVVFAAVRCADSTGTTPPRVESMNPAANAGVAATLAKLHATNDWVGRFHNDALGYVLGSLDRIPAKGRDRLTVCEKARRAYREFHRSRRGTDEPASVDEAFELFCARGSRSRPANAIAAPIDGRTPRAADAYATQQFMDQFATAIDASVSYDDLAARVNSIEAAAAASLSPDEVASVVVAGSIALASADYWANNITAWDPFVLDDTGLVPVVTRGISTPSIPGTSGSHDWGSWASRVWNDTKAAAKRAAHGDVTAAEKALVTGGALLIVGGPVSYDAILAASATGSIMAVLGG